MKLRRTPEEQRLYDEYRAAHAAFHEHSDNCSPMAEGSATHEESLRLSLAVARAEQAMEDAGMPLHLRLAVIW